MYILDQEEGHTETAWIQIDKNLSFKFFFFYKCVGAFVTWIRQIYSLSENSFRLSNNPRIPSIANISHANKCEIHHIFIYCILYSVQSTLIRHRIQSLSHHSFLLHFFTRQCDFTSSSWGCAIVYLEFDQIFDLKDILIHIQYKPFSRVN